MRWLFFSALTACGSYDIEDFTEELNAAYCDYVERCYDPDFCAEEGAVTFTPECTDTELDPAKAEACLQELEEAECEGDTPSLPRYCLEPCEE